MFPADKHIEDSLNRRKSESSLRSLRIYHDLTDFCSNDYLGFSSTGLLRARILEFNQKQPANIYEGSTGSRLISGNSAVAASLEEFIASYHNAEAALLFNSGYDANLGLFSSIPKRGDTIFYDDLVHASIRDGIRLSYAKSYSFRHNDITHLNELFRLAKGNVYVAVESVYSMHGDLAPLTELADICSGFGAHLIVDEAHATGVFGSQGRGCVSDLMNGKKVFARVHTFGKAMGTHGAAVICSNLLKEYLINFARSFIYTTFLPYHSLIAVRCAYSLLSDSEESILALHSNIKLFSESAAKSEFLNLQKSVSPVQCIIIPGNDRVVEAASAIQKKGFDVRPVMSPTVPAGSERLRICIHAFNSEKEIADLVYAVENALQNQQFPTAGKTLYED